jgi:hypothetical protein
MSQEHGEQNEPGRQRWQAYLEYLTKRAKRAALNNARLAEGDSDGAARRGSIDGQGDLHIEYTTLTDAPPWSGDDLEQFDALSGGGVWPSLREDADGEDGRDHHRE